MGLSVKAQCRLKYLGRSTKMGGLVFVMEMEKCLVRNAQYKSTKGVKEMGVQIVERQL